MGYFLNLGLFLAIFLNIAALLRWVFMVRKRKYQDYLDLFTGQMFTVIKANLPLAPGIKTLSYPGMKKGVRKVHTVLEKDLTSGALLSEAMAKHGRVFPEWYINIVRAGEESGNLEVAFEQILRHKESMMDFARNIAWPVGYFIFISLYIISIGMFNRMIILPQFLKISRDVGIYSHITNSLFFLSIDISLLLLGFIVILFLGLPFLRVLTRRIKKMRLSVDWLSLKLPLSGWVIRRLALVRFSRTLGVLFKSGVPVLKAIKTVKDMETNSIIHGLYEGLDKGTKEGNRLASQLRQMRFFPHTFIWMISGGEESGRLDEALINAADFYTLEIDMFLNRVVSLSLPVCVILAGIFVGTIGVKIFSIMVQLIEFVL